MEWIDSEQADGRAYRLTAAALLLVAVGVGGWGCGPDTDPEEDTGGMTADTTTGDAGMDGQEGTDTAADTSEQEPDGTDDGGSDGGTDGGTDAGDGGTDGGDADAGKPCKIEMIDTDQDRDRDGLRDGCDNFPYLNHGGDNPEQARLIQEDEPNNPNDDARDGEGYGLELPARIDGNVGPVEDDGDLDYYSFEVDEPTAVLVKIEAKSSEIWPGAIAFGYDFRNNNIQRVLLGAQTGEDSEREMYLPVPGKYTIAVSDTRNLLPDSNAADVPTSGQLDYRVHITKLPLPKLEQPGVPGTASHTYDERLHAYEVDASSLEGLQVDAQGVAVGMNSFQNPLVAVVNPENGRTLSYTIGQQVDTDTQKVELTTPLEENWDEVVVVEDHQQRFGNTSSKLDFSARTVDSEFETIQDPQDGRGDKLVWVQPGISVEGTIGPPRTASSTSLSPDVDYYMLSGMRGQGVTVTVEPTANSQLKPDLALGNYLARQGGGSLFLDSNGHNVPAAEMAGASRSVDFFFNGGSDGEIALRVRHAPNNSGDNPVGGSNYGYTLKVEPYSPSPKAVPSIPGQAQVDFGPGGMGFVQLSADKGQIIRITPNEPSGVSLFERGRLTRTSDWSGDREESGTFEFIAPQKETYWYDVRDSRGRGTDGKKMTVQVNKAATQSIQSLPKKITDKLDSGDDADYYRLDVQKGDLLDFRLKAGNFIGRIDLLELPSFSRAGIGFRDEVLAVESTGTIVVKVSSASSDGGDYTLGIQKISPTGLGSIPVSQSGTIDDEPFPVWHKMPVTKGKAYQLDLTETGMSDLDSRVEVYKPSGLDRVESSGSGSLRFIADWQGEAYVAIFDDDQRGDASYTFDLAVDEVSTAQATVGQTVQGMLADGQDEIIYTFSASAGAVDAVVDSKGAWTPKVTLLEGSDLDEVNGPEQSRGTVRYAGSQMQDYALLVEARDAMRSGPLNYDLTVRVDGTSSNTTESEPNNVAMQAQKLTTFPAVVEADLGMSGDSDDYYAVDLQAGQKVWALAIPKDPNNRYRMQPKFELIDPSGSVAADDQYDGDGSFPGLYARRADQSGQWTIRLQRQQSNYSGTYYLYVYTSEVFTATESEPNDAQMSAQALGTIDAPAKISATVDGNDPTDIYTFDLQRDLDSLRIFLEGAAGGHDIRLLDDTFTQIAASGPSHDGKTDPDISASSPAAGTYYLEVTQGNGGGSLDVIMWQDP